MSGRKPHLLLFDIDGTLTPARQKMSAETAAALKEAAKYYDLGIVGGSDRAKQLEQLSGFEDIFHWAFPENGTVAMENGKIFNETNVAKHFGEEKFQEMINFLLRYVADLKIPIKRGTFVEYRTGLVNASPIGRNCSQKERDEFNELNKKEKILENMAEAIRQKFSKDGWFVSVGGQISIDIFPIGWDKTNCLQFVDKLYDQIHFFGDKTHQGGNDYEIFTHKRVIGHSVGTDGPKKTVEILNELLSKAKGSGVEGMFAGPSKQEKEGEKKEEKHEEKHDKKNDHPEKKECKKCDKAKEQAHDKDHAHGHGHEHEQKH